MTIWTALVAIVAIVMGTQLMRDRQRHRRDLPPDNAPPAADDGLHDEIAALKDRIKVLERIAYDDSRKSDLADEIERLRD